MGGGGSEPSCQPNLKRWSPPLPHSLAAAPRRSAFRGTYYRGLVSLDAHRARSRPGPGRIGWLLPQAAEPFWTAPAHPNRRRRRQSGLGHGEAARPHEQRGPVIPPSFPTPLPSPARTPCPPPPHPHPGRARPQPGAHTRTHAPAHTPALPRPPPSPVAEPRHACLASPPAAPAAPTAPGPRWTE